MKAEEFLNNWLNQKYGGGKEVEPWTDGEVVSLLKDFQKQIWEEVEQSSYEVETSELTYIQIDIDDLREILEQNNG